MTKDDTTTKPEFYKLNVATLPDDLFQADVPVEKWLDLCETTSDKAGFTSINKVYPIPLDVHLERIVGISLYMWLNVLPFFVFPLLVMYIMGWALWFVYGCIIYTAILGGTETFIFQPWFSRKYRQAGYLLESKDTDYRQNQYVFTERNTSKYMSMSFVWGRQVHPPALQKTPALFCVVPHGVVPFGITAYPFWSKVWNDRLCRWTTAPVVLQIPIVGYLIRKIGYIPAKAPAILKSLTEGDTNVGVILDGIAGMFHQSATEERATLQQRKGIVKIALKAGVPIIPVYAFGHTAAYTVLVDPFGILEKVSISLQTSLTPFLGRWGWPLGPPRRVPVTMCLGNPVYCPKTDDPTQEQIDKYHGQLLQHYQEVFDQHKTAYGWKDKRIKFV